MTTSFINIQKTFIICDSKGIFISYNAWPFRLNYSFFHYFSCLLSYSSYKIPPCVRTKVCVRPMDDTYSRRPRSFLSFFSCWLFSPIIASRWLGAYECHQPYQIVIYQFKVSRLSKNLINRGSTTWLIKLCLTLIIYVICNAAT